MCDCGIPGSLSNTRFHFYALPLVAFWGKNNMFSIIVRIFYNIYFDNLRKNERQALMKNNEQNLIFQRFKTSIANKPYIL